jgi:Dyp-type peroxidase family
MQARMADNGSEAEESEEAGMESAVPQLELGDIQSGALYPRPSPYVGRYILLRIDDRCAGRELMRRLLPAVDASRSASEPVRDAWVTVALSYQGLKALGVPQASLDSFAPEFKQGMAARAEILGDVGDSSPANWEAPLGTPDVHVALAAISPDIERLEAVAERARKAYDELSGVEVIWRQDCYQLPTERTSFGFKDGIGNPAVEGSGVPSTNPHEAPLKAGEILLGYPDESGKLPPMPQPDVLGRNGTYLAFRKLRTNVAAYRQYLRANAATREEEALLGAKMVGRWQSGAPLALSPDQDDPELGADASRNNAFVYHEDDPRGFKCPAGSHARRMNPRDSLEGEGVHVRLHRMIRRGTSYGPMLPEGVLEDDGVDRGIVFVFVGAHLDRQFEFVKTQWVNDGIFIGAPSEQDPLVGPHHEPGAFTIPRRPIRRRLQNLPPFVITRGGEYLFAPSLPALRWLADLDS